MKNVIVFDLDGTLLDTSVDLTSSVNYALNKNGCQSVTKVDVIRNTGNGIKKLMERSMPKDANQNTIDKAFQDFKDRYKDHAMDETSPYPEMKETLIELKKRGYKMVVVSNKANVLACKIIEHFYKGIFSFVTGEREGYQLKPSSDLIDLALKEIDGKKEYAYYVGDSSVDYQTAINSGIDPIMCTYGFRTKDELVSLGAKVFIDKPKELLNLIK